MAFSSTINNNGTSEIAGRKRYVSGTFTNTANSTGGDVPTSLRRVEHFDITITNSSTAHAHSVTETFPTATGDITILTPADVSGIWRAEGD